MGPNGPMMTRVWQHIARCGINEVDSGEFGADLNSPLSPEARKKLIELVAKLDDAVYHLRGPDGDEVASIVDDIHSVLMRA